MGDPNQVMLVQTAQIAIVVSFALSAVSANSCFGFYYNVLVRILQDRMVAMSDR